MKDDDVFDRYNAKPGVSSLLQQWRNRDGVWTLSRCPTCGTVGADVKTVIELLAEARDEIAAWYFEHCGKPAEDLDVVRKIDAMLAGVKKN